MALKKYTTAGIIALSLAFTSPLALADGHKGGDKKGGKPEIQKMLKGIELTAEQKTELNALFAKMKEERKAARTEMRAKAVERRAEMQKLVFTNDFNEGAFRAFVEKNQQERVERKVERAKEQNAVFKLLTPEQQTQFLANLAKKAEKQQQRMQKRMEAKQSN